jgi:hypothetical protein
MVDRVRLLSVVMDRVADRGNLPVQQASKFNALLKKALAIALAELTLEDARILSPQERSELESTLRDLLEPADLKNVSKKWEPKRKIDGHVHPDDVAEGLIELLRRKREPYSPSATTLEQARKRVSGEKANLRESISRWASDADRKSLAKKWDKDNPALTSEGRDRLIAGLLSLLDGKTEPLVKMKKAKAG